MTNAGYVVTSQSKSAVQNFKYAKKIPTQISILLFILDFFPV